MFLVKFFNNEAEVYKFSESQAQNLKNFKAKFGIVIRTTTLEVDVSLYEKSITNDSGQINYFCVIIGITSETSHR